MVLHVKIVVVVVISVIFLAGSASLKIRIHWKKNWVFAIYSREKRMSRGILTLHSPPNDLKNDFKHRYKRKSSAGGSDFSSFSCWERKLENSHSLEKIGFSLYTQGRNGYLGVY